MDDPEEQRMTANALALWFVLALVVLFGFMLSNAVRQNEPTLDENVIVLEEPRK